MGKTQEWIDKDKLLEYVRKELNEAKENYETLNKRLGEKNPGTAYMKGAFEALDDLEGWITNGRFK